MCRILSGSGDTGIKKKKWKLAYISRTQASCKLEASCANFGHLSLSAVVLRAYLFNVALLDRHLAINLGHLIADKKNIKNYTLFFIKAVALPPS